MLTVVGVRLRKQRGDGIRTYLSLQCTDDKLIQGLAGLVAVADILECLSGVLTGDI